MDFDVDPYDPVVDQYDSEGDYDIPSSPPEDSQAPVSDPRPERMGWELPEWKLQTRSPVHMAESYRNESHSITHLHVRFWFLTNSPREVLYL